MPERRPSPARRFSGMHSSAIVALCQRAAITSGSRGLDGKQPYFISAAAGGVLSLAALWDQWRNPETNELMTSFTIIVTDANTLTGTIHDRMPVVLDNAHVGSWLDCSGGTEL